MDEYHRVDSLDEAWQTAGPSKGKSKAPIVSAPEPQVKPQGHPKSHGQTKQHGQNKSQGKTRQHDQSQSQGQGKKRGQIKPQTQVRPQAQAASLTSWPTPPIRSAPTALPDNTGSQMFKNDDKPSLTFIIPQTINLPPKPDFTAEMAQIGQRTNTYSHFSGYGPGHNGRKFPIVIKIWGTQNDAASAKADVQSLISHLNPSFDPKQKWWAKVKHWSVVAQEEVLLDAEEERQQYRRPPPLGSIFEARGWFEWPFQGLDMRDCLGSNLQAIDPIRMDAKCYIIIDAEHRALEIMGNNEGVLKAIRRLRQHCQQIEARPAYATRQTVLHWLDPTFILARVKLIDIARQIVQSATLKVGLLTEKTPRTARAVGEFAGMYEVDRSHQLSTSANALEGAVAPVLTRLSHHRAKIEMCARLGTLVLGPIQQTEDGSFDLNDFKQLITSRMFRASTTEEISDLTLEKSLLRRARTADELLRPARSLETRLQDVRPNYTVVLVVEQQKRIKIQKTWQEDGANLDCIATTWSYPKSTAASGVLLDFSLFDLADSLAWCVEIKADDVVDEERIPAMLRDFADYQWKIDRKKARKHDLAEQWVEFGMEVPGKQSLQQRTEWNFAMHNSDYVLQVAKVQDLKYVKASSGSAQSVEPMTPYWTVTVTNQGWTVKLGENATLEVGKGATWSSEVSAWFPQETAERTGTENFIEKLDTVHELITGRTRESFGGMTVG